MWSDGWTVVRQHEGNLVLDASNGLHKAWPIQAVGENAADIVNQILGVVGLAARATTVPPWPLGRTETTAKAVKGALMAAEVTLADLAAQIQVLIVNSEQVNSRLAAIEEHLAGAETEQPPAPPATDELDLWATLLTTVEPPEWVTLPQTSFNRERALTQAWWGYSPINGSQVLYEPGATQRRSFLRAIYSSDSVDSMPPLEAQFWTLMEKHGISWDEAAYAVLVGLIRPSEWGSFSARPDDEFISVAGKSLERLWHDVADVRQGGGPGEGGA